VVQEKWTVHHPRGLTWPTRELLIPLGWYPNRLRRLKLVKMAKSKGSCMHDKMQLAKILKVAQNHSFHFFEVGFWNSSSYLLISSIPLVLAKADTCFIAKLRFLGLYISSADLSSQPCSLILRVSCTEMVLKYVIIWDKSLWSGLLFPVSTAITQKSILAWDTHRKVTMSRHKCSNLELRAALNTIGGAAVETQASVV
jgi:hypothetical protein